MAAILNGEEVPAVVSPSPLRLSSGANGKPGNRPKVQDVIELLGSNCIQEGQPASRVSMAMSGLQNTRAFPEAWRGAANSLRCNLSIFSRGWSFSRAGSGRQFSVATGLPVMSGVMASSRVDAAKPVASLA